ncbi:hypothetical protein ACFVUS_16155 [Nocardia sp. NPDC058058]|uniref:hypothetical protein n=1 Tax=Nocardia sp. NPDC058058 TaxID=3346317 RepID=UPI0036DDB25F
MGAASEAKQAQLAELRRRMAAIPARGVQAAAAPGPRAAAAPRAATAGPRPDTAELRPVGADSRAVTGVSPIVPGSSAAGAPPARVSPQMAEEVGARALAESLRRDALPVPAALESLLPEGGLAKGSVVRYSGGNALLSGLLAAVTGSGGHAAVIGLPRFGLLAAAEMGARLERLAVVADPGSDPLEVASVLLDGLDLVVLGLNGARVPMSRTRVLTARARNRGSTLVVTGGSWAGPVLRIDTRVDEYSGLGRGRGRLRTLRLDVSVQGRSAQPRTGKLALCPNNGRVEWVDTNHVAAEPLTAVRHAVS